MQNTITDARMNDLLVEVHRSLARYTQEVIYAWLPGDGQKLKDAVKEVDALQEAIVKKMVDYLMARGNRVDFGVYPHEYSSLHFVSIDFLGTQLVGNAHAIADELVAALPEFEADSAARQLVEESATVQQQCLALLQAALPATV